LAVNLFIALLVSVLVDISFNVTRDFPHILRTEKQLNLLSVAPTGLMSPTQPVGQLLGVPAHLGSEFFERQTVELFVPRQPLKGINRAFNGIVTEESDDSRDVTEIDGPAEPCSQFQMVEGVTPI